MRLNLILFVVIIIFALATINSEHQYRRNFSKLNMEDKKTLDLRDKQTKLQLEESDKSGIERIENIAKNKLKMYVPNNKEKEFLNKK
jgi:cell division protein FtsL